MDMRFGRNDREHNLGIAKVIEARKGHSENSTDKRLYCDLILDNGVTRKNVPFYGPTVDIVTKKLHGVLFPPRPKQMVAYAFIQGHIENPVACFSLPYNWGQKNFNIVNDTINNDITSIDDCALYHKSGSKVIMRDNGDIEITQAENQNIIINEGEKGAARLDDEVKSTTTEDSAFWSWATKYNTFNIAWFAAATTLAGGSGTPAEVIAYGEAVVAALTPLGTIPASLTGKITEASDKVKIGD